MTPVKVHMPLSAIVSPPALNQLLQAAGLTAESEADWLADCPEGDMATPAILPVVATAGDSELLKAAVRAAVSQGDRVIAVWPPGASGGVIPASLADLGTSLVPWDPIALHAAICGKVLEWQDAGGGRREAPPLKRNQNC